MTALYSLRRAALLAAACALATPPAARAQGETVTLEVGLQAAAAAWAKDTRLAGKSVAVVRFALLEGEKRQYSASPLNLVAARKLEKSMLLAVEKMPGEPPFALLREGSAAVFAGGPFDFLDKARPQLKRKLFETAVAPAWGDGPATQPDVVLTGVIQIDRDSPNVAQVLVCGVFANTLEVKWVEGSAFSAHVSAALLMDAGFGFTQGSPFARRTSLKPDAAPADGSQLVAAGRSAARAALSRPPGDLPGDEPAVRLEVIYDGQVQPVTLGPTGECSVPEPPEGCTTQYRLTRTYAGPERIGAVLRINGMSAIDGGEKSPDQCRVFVLSNPGDSVTVDGWYFEEDGGFKSYKFQSVPGDHPAMAQITNSQMLGMLDLTAFKECDEPQQSSAESKLAERNDALGTPTQPQATAKATAKAAKNDLVGKIGATLGFIAPRGNVGTNRNVSKTSFKNRARLSFTPVRYKQP